MVPKSLMVSPGRLRPRKECFRALCASNSHIQSGFGGETMSKAGNRADVEIVTPNETGRSRECGMGSFVTGSRDCH